MPGLSLRILLAAAVSLAFPMQPAAAQNQSVPKLPEFEVASVKAVDPNARHTVGVSVYPGGRLVISCLTLKTLVAAAFQVPYGQISGGEAWTETEG